jgi:hypothetical protein
VNFVADASNNVINLSWGAPTNSSFLEQLIGFRIYRNGVEYVEMITETMFADISVVNDTMYEYEVVGYFDGIGESLPSATMMVTPTAFEFTLISDGFAFSIARGQMTATEVIIPGVRNGLPVTAICTSGFSDYADMTDIFIPISITVIGSMAFLDCIGLSEIEIPIGVTNIGENAFLGCIQLTIYAEATNPEIDPTSPAHNWHSTWNPDDRPVVWGTVSDYDRIEVAFDKSLVGNYPNPFNLETTISFSVTAQSSSPLWKSETSATNHHVRIEVFNIRGQRVRSLVDGLYETGSHIVVWNGTDDNGFSVGSGVYLYRMTAGDYTSVRRMILLK